MYIYPTKFKSTLMTYIKLSGIPLLFMSLFCSAQTIHFPDAQFENALLNTLCVDTDFDGIGDKNADLNDDGEIEINEAQQIINLKIDSQNIESLEWH